MHIFEKLPQILGPCSIVKFRSTLEKSDPQNIWRTPLNRKILNALLRVKEANHYFARNNGIIVYGNVVGIS